MTRSHAKDTEDITIIDQKGVTSKSEAPSLSIVLTVIQGSDIDFGKSYTCSGQSIRLGRSKDNTIEIDDRKVSKKHCELSFAHSGGQEEVIIKDLRSTNGTFVNGKRIKQQILKSGDKIAVGETVLRMDCNDLVEEEYRAKLFTIAATDILTGLYNRRYILNQLEKQYKIAKRNNRVFSVLVLDIDDFKLINDTYGHSAGDEFLKKVSFTINRTLREQDIAGRIGGEEFLIILPETDLEGAYTLADRIRHRIESAHILYQQIPIQATISTGVSYFNPKTPPVKSEILFQWADQALYIAKKSGKNRVVKHKVTAAKREEGIPNKQ